MLIVFNYKHAFFKILFSSSLRKSNVPVYRGISQFLLIKDLETQQELKIAHMHLKEHQVTIDKFRERVSERRLRFQLFKRI